MLEQAKILRQPLALGKALRPHQWIKNGLVFLPLVFAVRVAWSPDNLGPLPELLIDLLVVFVAFCAVSSGVYLINDLSDRAADRNHPVKRHRPIASGALAVPPALASVVILIGAGLAALALLDLVLLWVSLGYLGINLAYSLGVKNVVLVDVLAVAGGYVIRVALGALAIGVIPSPWLYATTAAGALFIVLGRRYAEVRLAGDDALSQRSVLSRYAGPFIGQLLTISATAAWVSYTLYTVEAANLPQNDAMLLTVPLVTVGLFRYLYLLNTSKDAESPEQLIIKDLPMVLSIVGWMAGSAAILLLAG
ncbi:MAG: decaprenyl-phosphate phosphoribosyltransferase [SAR202 cluster bacterium Io17-Chloro-G9]|nr:MAG: decaprenyl-phosphate phosphoribosyltransferase [SAR202 cluster bacterium Io17-Chloro-G9]